jgi:hypothetical protein
VVNSVSLSAEVPLRWGRAFFALGIRHGRCAPSECGDHRALHASIQSIRECGGGQARDSLSRDSPLARCLVAPLPNLTTAAPSFVVVPRSATTKRACLPIAAPRGGPPLCLLRRPFP